MRDRRGAPSCSSATPDCVTRLFVASEAARSLPGVGIVAKSVATFVTLGDLHTAEVVVASLGFRLIVVLDRLRMSDTVLNLGAN